MQQALDISARTLPVPEFLPEHIRRGLSGKEVAFDLAKPVRMRLRSPEKIRVSEWAERFRIVAEGAHEGLWRHELAPHTVKIMDTYGLPWVREVWFCGVEQSGKTNTMINCLGWAIDCDPGNAFYLMPTEDTSAKVVGGKLKPTLQRSPRLARYLSDRQDDTTLARINLRHGVTILPAWANSPSSLATWTAKHCFGDEVDKYPALSGREADPITLLKKRNRNYKGRFKRMFCSTPAGMFIYKGMLNCHQVWEFRVVCPECGEEIRMDADHLVIPEGATAEQIERDGCSYACNGCGVEWDDDDRESAIRAGRWVCVQGAEVSRPAKVGFHHRAWECLDVPLAEIGAAWVKSNTGDMAAKIAWANGYEAVDYVEEKVDRDEEQILLLCDDRPTGIVPAAPIVSLLLTVDTQSTYFWYVLRAHGYGMDQESWMVRCGQLQTFEAIERLMYELDFLDANGVAYRVGAVAIDTGGTQKEGEDTSRTYQVYDWARNHPMVYPFKGAKRQAAPFRVSHVDFFPGTNKPIPGGLKLYNINSNFYKDELSRRLLIPPTDPGAFHLHSGFEAHHLQESLRPANGLKEYARHMTAEYRDERGQWLTLQHRRHDYWDCEVYQIALADILDLRYELRPEERESRAVETVQPMDKKAKPIKQRRW